MDFHRGAPPPAARRGAERIAALLTELGCFCVLGSALGTEHIPVLCSMALNEVGFGEVIDR